MERDPRVSDFSNASVLVLGDIMLDRYWSGVTARISPEAPIPVVRVEKVEERPGGAANVALNIKALGAHAVLAGVAGQDEAAVVLERLLEMAGVECQIQRVSGFSTITKLRVLSRHQQLIRLDFEDGFVGFDLRCLTECLEQHSSKIQVAVLSDYGKGTMRCVQELIQLAREMGKTVVVDPKGRDFTIYHGANILTPNLEEFEAVVGPCSDEDQLVKEGEGLRDHLGLDALLITRGEHGMTLLERGHFPLHLPARAREVYDVTGAGDTVIGVMAAALAAGQTLRQAAALANLAAGLVVGKLGAATVSPVELQAALDPPELGQRGVVDEEALLSAVAAARARAEVIVMTNGCFDLLHAGHVACLERARELGDRLVVAVNDDASVRHLKGGGRPVIPLAQRVAVLAALRCVDWVVPFFEDTPERLIAQVMPDVLVKGGDYHPEEIAGSRLVTANGGRVVILEYKPGCSTSGILEHIRHQMAEAQ